MDCVFWADSLRVWQIIHYNDRADVQLILSNSYVDVYVAGPVVCVYFKVIESSSIWTNVGQLPAEYTPLSSIIVCVHMQGAYIRVDSDGKMSTYKSANTGHTGAITYIIPL